MSKIKTLVKLLKNDRKDIKKAIAINLSRAKLSRLLPDKIYLKCMYSMLLDKKLNLKSPKTFNEKLQWLKIYDHNPEYCKLVDKHEVKCFIEENIGKEYIIPTYYVYNDFDEIDFDKLPDKFVLKCTHDSGSTVICRNKATFDIEKARKKLTKKLKMNLYWHGREWPYKDLKPRIIAEQYMEDEINPSLIDYKFYCFNGEPKFLYVSKDMDNHVLAAMAFITLDWQFASYERGDYNVLTELPPKPQNFEHMVELARKLSKDFDFLRVDLYEINNKVYFSELTFFPAAGFTLFKNPEHDLEMGNMLEITTKGKK